jgi:ribosomal protein L40E
MLQVICQNCTQPNPDVARICRYCGHALLQPDAARRPTGHAQRPTDYAPPQGSYAPTHDWASSAPLPAPPVYTLATPQPLLSAEHFRCPHCQTTVPPIIAHRISAAGWIVFACLLVFCLPLFFIGLLMKEEYRMCSWCRAPLS